MTHETAEYPGWTRGEAMRRLAADLDVCLPIAVGTVVMLRFWMMDHPFRVRHGTYSAAQIARACEWEGDRERLVAALKAGGFLPTPKGGDK